METRTGIDPWLLAAATSCGIWVVLYSVPLWWATGDGSYGWNVSFAAVTAFASARAPSGRLLTWIRAGALLAIALVFRVCVREAVTAQLALRSAAGS